MPHPRPLRVRQRAAALIQSEGRVLLHRVVGDAFWALPGGASSRGRLRHKPWSENCRKNWASPWSPARWPVWWKTSSRTLAPRTTRSVCICTPLRCPVVFGCRAPGPYAGVEGSRALVFAWFGPDELEGIDVRPAFLAAHLRHWLVHGRAEVAHIVHRDPGF